MRQPPRTVVRLPLSRAAYDEIASKLRAAGYDQAFMPGGQIDMFGIAVESEDTPDAHHPTLNF